MKLVDVARKNSSNAELRGNKKKYDLLDADALDMLEAYLKHEITTTGMVEALSSLGFKCAAGASLHVLMQRALTLARRNEIEIIIKRKF